MLERAALCVLLITLGAGSAEATQHLVSPGESWQRIAARLDAGDEVLLRPGRHVGAMLEDCHGEPSRPIVIRSLDPQRPAVIDAENYGLRLRGCSHVHIKDLAIENAKVAGIAIESASAGGDEDTTPPSLGFELTNVAVRDTGPSGARHGIALRDIQDVQLRDVTVTGWGGSAIEAVGVRGLVVQRSTLRGKDGFTQQAGIRLRAGTERVEIAESLLDECGAEAIVVGGASKAAEFPAHLPPLGEDGRDEASSVLVQQTVIVGPQCALSVIHGSSVRLESCTIVRPRRYVVSIRDEPSPVKRRATRDVVLGSCIVTWIPGDLSLPAHIPDPADQQALNLEENLWWCSGWDEESVRLLPWPGAEPAEQLTDLDPDLDSAFTPRAIRAEGFGARPVPLPPSTATDASDSE